MIEIRRILCPMDFSETSRHALEHAVAIGRWYGSHITTVHVIRPAFVPGPPIVFTGFPVPMPADVDRPGIEAKMREWLQPATEAGLRTDTLVVDGNPAPRILECATSLPADLIVVGTHGLGGVERFLLGSVAERVLRKAPCPVLTVPPRSTSKARLPYKRLLCPVDFSDSSLAAFQFVVSLAKVSDAHLTILHVFDWPPHDEPLFERFDTPEFRRLVESEARGRLEALVTDDLRTWCTPATKIGYGKPYRRILEVADAERSDLIVIGVQGRNAIDLTLFGSTTNHVVRRASCPVLTLRH